MRNKLEIRTARMRLTNTERLLSRLRVMLKWKVRQGKLTPSEAQQGISEFWNRCREDKDTVKYNELPQERNL